MRILVTGATGLLGGWLVSAIEDAVAYGGPGRPEGIDLTDADAVDAVLARARPDAVIHAAAMAAIADCARDPVQARRVNAGATASLARACDARGIRLVHVSTDLVFDGEAAPYDEAATPRPLSVYGRTKLEAEREALGAKDAAVVRVSLLFGPTRTERRGFFDGQIEALRLGRLLPSFDDEWRTPLSLRAAAEGLVAIAEGGLRGVVHLGGPERLSRHEMGLALARVLGADPSVVVRASRTQASGEPRPRDVSLDRSAFATAFPTIACEPFSEECRRMGI